MLRVQTVRPTLCGHACLVEQTWDTTTGLVVSERILEKCTRHAGKSDLLVRAAITEESGRWNAVMAALDGQSIVLNGGTITASAAMNATTGNLEITSTGITAAKKTKIRNALTARGITNVVIL